MTRFSRRSAAGFALEVTALVVIFLSLGAWYALRFEHLGTVWDIWFGADIPRLIRWIEEPAYVERWHLHPLPILPLKAYGQLLDALRVPSSPRLLPLYSLPLIVLVAVCITASARVVTGSGKALVPSFLVAVGLAAFASMLAFAPIPECHAAGGALLLLQASLVLQSLVSRPPEAQTSRRVSTWILLSGAAAAGFTLSNLMPAAILAAPTLLKERTKVWIALLVVLVLGGGLAVLVANGQGGSMGALLRNWLYYELDWTYMPTPTTLRHSFTGLVTFQFGIPDVRLNTWANPFDGTTVMSIAPREPGLLHQLALLAWVAGIGIWWLSRSGTLGEKQFVLLSAAACASLVAFHSIYGSYESYVVSPHSWPYIALPGFIAGVAAHRQRSRLPMALIAVALVIACVQSARGLRSLNRLPAQPGHIASAVTRPGP